jgi:NADPH:quinone reductase-like Zn-dependent oxidoreductase
VKAIQAAHRGGYDALRLVDIPRPQSRAGRALVRVTSAGVTPLDRTVLASLHPTARKLPLVPGNEGAGVVIEDPSGRFPAGQRVLFFAGRGSERGAYAEGDSAPSGGGVPSFGPLAVCGARAGAADDPRAASRPARTGRGAARG